MTCGRSGFHVSRDEQSPRRLNAGILPLARRRHGEAHRIALGECRGVVGLGEHHVARVDQRKLLTRRRVQTRTAASTRCGRDYDACEHPCPACRPEGRDGGPGPGARELLAGHDLYHYRGLGSREESHHEAPKTAAMRSNETTEGPTWPWSPREMKPGKPGFDRQSLHRQTALGAALPQTFAHVDWIVVRAIAGLRALSLTGPHL